MKKPSYFQLLVIIMTVATLLVTAVSITSLYDTAFDQHRQRLIETVNSQARLIEAIAQFDSQNNNKNPNVKWQALTLGQIKSAHSKFEGFGDTGEYTLARKSGSQIEFLLRHRHNNLDTPKPIPFSGNWAKAMRFALQGKSGILIGLDYRGTKVLAAYEPIDVLDLGLVAKIDIDEIRAPFVRAALITLAIAILVILIASTVFFRITRPIHRQIEKQAETFTTLVDIVREAIILIDINGIIQFSNPAAEKLFGYSSGELIGSNVNRLMPSPHREAHDGYIKNYLETGVERIIGIGRQLTGLRKDGSYFPMHLSVGDMNLAHARLFTGVIMDLSEQQKLQRQIMEIPHSEQRKIGQDLHDGLGQQLTGLGMLATSLLNKASKPDHELAKQLAEGLKEAVSQVRALSRGLMPVEIGMNEFNLAIQNLCDEIERQSNIIVHCKIDPEFRLSDDTAAMHLYRIAQEALNNAIKHSGASQIKLTLKMEQNYGLLEIQDNGCGISNHITPSSGLGMSIMKYRSGLFNSDFTIDPNPDTGTRVSCRFPLNSVEQVDS